MRCVNLQGTLFRKDDLADIVLKECLESGLWNT